MATAQELGDIMVKMQLRHQEQLEKQMAEQERRHQEQIKAMTELFKTQSSMSSSSSNTTVTAAIPVFTAFDPSSELWKDYWARFETYAEANSIATSRLPHVFLTNQSPVIYKLLSNLAQQQTPPKETKELSLETIRAYMEEQFHPKRFIVRERFKFWSGIGRHAGESVQELVSRIRQDAITCDFPSIKNPLDEALRTRFICSVNNEAILKALFKVKDEDLTFAKAIEVAMETEDAAKVAKETVYGAMNSSKAKAVSRIQKKPPRNTHEEPTGSSTVTCYRCGKLNHKADVCRYKLTTCNACHKVGHLAKVCKSKGSKYQTSHSQGTSHKLVKAIRTVNKATSRGIPELHQTVKLNGQPVNFEVDTGAGDSFIGDNVWNNLGQPELSFTGQQYESASQHTLPIRGTVTLQAQKQQADGSFNTTKGVDFNVSETPYLNLLGRNAIKDLEISVDELMNSTKVHAVFDSLESDITLQRECHEVCQEFPDLFKPGLGLLKDFELEVKFKPDVKPVFCKPRPVPFALQEDLVHAYKNGIKTGVWKKTQFCPYGTPVVPIRKSLLPGQSKQKLRVCGDYSVTVNPQLETHRYPIPTPEELMQKLAGGYGFSKIDLADAYSQIALGPESQKRLALSTHEGPLLQCRLPFGISSAPGYFQEIMDQLTRDLPGVAVYLDDILVSGNTAQEHVNNLRRLLQRLNEKGLRCRLEKCVFAQPCVEYLGHSLSKDGIAKATKNVDAIRKMPPPTDVSSLRSFLGSVQFHAKFLKDLATVLEPLYKLTKKNVQWKWENEEQTVFEKVKAMLCEETVLTHFNPSLPIGISCDASNVGIGAVLFHRYDDGSERPIYNVSKTLTDTQRKYSQIQKEALAIVFALKKFHQFLYGRKFILVTDHKPLIALFGPTKPTPALAANRLARWALMLSQYEYSVEYRKTSDHSNADALSRLPVGDDKAFDREESQSDTDTICCIKTINSQLNPADPRLLAKESAKDRVISQLIRYTREGWPNRGSGNDHTDDPYSVHAFRKVKDSLSVVNGCLFLGMRAVIPESLQPKVLQLLHLGHFGMEKMKQLARTAVYWPGIDSKIMDMSRTCTSCAEHQNKPPKPPVHPWMIPEKPWSRVHLDHAINFMGCNWLVIVDAYSKYPCIHTTSSTSSSATIDLLEEDFAHFGYPHTLVTDNATTFTSEEFQEWCQSRGIVHLTGAPYHPATNGAAERLVQSFKSALKKSSLPPKKALLQFLIQYRRTPTASGYSPSELLNGRQIRTLIDTLAPSPVAKAQQVQKQQMLSVNQFRREPKFQYRVGSKCYALYCGPRQERDPRWVPAIVTKTRGNRTFHVRVIPHGPVWRRHIEQLRPWFPEDNEPGDNPTTGSSEPAATVQTVPDALATAQTIPNPRPKRPNPRWPTDSQYNRDNPRRSERRMTQK